MNRRTLLIGAAGIVGLLILLFVSQWLTNRPSTGTVGTTKVDRQQAQRRAALGLHQLCLQADSLGIDTTRFSVAATDTVPQLTDKQKRLLLELRYGKKPSRLSFNGLHETVDSTDSAPVTASAFAPYNQLVGHYNRLRREKVSPDSLRLIRQTLNFYRYLNRFPMDQFVIVNIPAGQLNVFDRAGQRLLPMQVIVGKSDSKTPCMTTSMSEIVTYPYWNVPKRIATEEMLPKIQRDLFYLESQNLEVLDDRERTVDPETIDWDGLSVENFPYRIRQASGCDNSLGLIKFNLVNPLAIYLHDTNNRDLFSAKMNSFRSHGCVRVQKPVELANFLLRAEVFDKGYMDRCLIDQKPKTLKLPKPFPVFIVYNTADVDAAGQLRFYRDIYALDK